MEKVTVLESIIKTLNLIASVPFFIEILILTIILLIAMLFFYFRKSKKGKVTCLIIYIVTLGLLPISHLSFFAQTIDKVIENYIKILYFPSCYVYMVLLIVTDVSVFSNIVKNIKKTKQKWYTSFDLLYFFIFQFLFFIIIRTVITENIDIFERVELYSNSSLTSALQISSYLFWIRFGVKFIAFVVNRLSGEKTSSLDKIKNENIDFKTQKLQSEKFDVKEDINSTMNISDSSISSVSTFNIDKSQEVVDTIQSSQQKTEEKVMTDALLNDGKTYKKEIIVNEIKPSNKNEEVNNMNSLNVITSIKNENKKNIKLLSDDLIFTNVIEPNKSNDKAVNNFEKEIVQKEERKPNYNIELKEDDEIDNYFDDFYE